MIALNLRVKSRSTIPLLPGFMHLVIYVVFPGSVRFSFYPKFATDLTEPGYQYFTF